MISIYDISDSVKVIVLGHIKSDKNGIVIKTWSGDESCCLIRFEDGQEFILDDSHLLLI
tara:strand:+ start:173 stop:349 length:177 start_codon:yes stop_codon:yes gene_type:complete